MLHSKELASPEQMASALAIPEQSATGKETSNLFMAVSLDLSRLTTTLNRLERSIQTGINKWYQSLLRNSKTARLSRDVTKPDYIYTKLMTLKLDSLVRKILLLSPQ
ncbi:hypothetical protein Tco_0212026 [Tanacetum coccineum]